MKTRLFFFFLLLSFSANAQIGFRVFNYSPLKNAPFILGNTVSGELLFTNYLSNNSRFMTQGRIGLINHTILFKTIPGYISSRGLVGDGITISPSQQIQESFIELYVSIGVDFNIINYEKYNFYIGADLLAGAYSTKNASYNKIVSSEGNDSSGLLGIRTRMGTSYLIKNWLEPFAEAGYTAKRYYRLSDFGAVDLGIGIKFWIDGKD